MTDDIHDILQGRGPEPSGTFADSGIPLPLLNPTGAGQRTVDLLPDSPAPGEIPTLVSMHLDEMRKSPEAQQRQIDALGLDTDEPYVHTIENFYTMSHEEMYARTQQIQPDAIQNLDDAYRKFNSVYDAPNLLNNVISRLSAVWEGDSAEAATAALRSLVEPSTQYEGATRVIGGKISALGNVASTAKSVVPPPEQPVYTVMNATMIAAQVSAKLEEQKRIAFQLTSVYTPGYTIAGTDVPTLPKPEEIPGGGAGGVGGGGGWGGGAGGSSGGGAGAGDGSGAGAGAGGVAGAEDAAATQAASAQALTGQAGSAGMGSSASTGSASGGSFGNSGAGAVGPNGTYGASVGPRGTSISPGGFGGGGGAGARRSNDKRDSQGGGGGLIAPGAGAGAPGGAGAAAGAGAGAGAAAAAAAKPSMARPGMGMGMPMGMAGAGGGNKGGEDTEHKTASYLINMENGNELIGDLPPASPPVLGA